MGDAHEFEVDWEAMQSVGHRDGGGTFVRVDDALHVVDSLPTARSTDGLRPAACSEGSWAVRRVLVEGPNGIVVEAFDYHALHRLDISTTHRRSRAG